MAVGQIETADVVGYEIRIHVYENKRKEQLRGVFTKHDKSIVTNFDILADNCIWVSIASVGVPSICNQSDYMDIQNEFFIFSNPD